MRAPSALALTLLQTRMMTASVRLARSVMARRAQQMDHSDLTRRLLLSAREAPALRSRRPQATRLS